MISSFLFSNSSVAMKISRSSSRIAFERSRTLRSPCSECERRGTANRRSFRSILPLLFFVDPAKNPDDAASQHDAWESRRIVDHHDVERIAVIDFGRWHEAPIMCRG